MMVSAGEEQRKSSSADEKEAAAENGRVHTKNNRHGDLGQKSSSVKGSPARVSFSLESEYEVKRAFKNKQPADKSFEHVLNVKSPRREPFSKPSNDSGEPLPITLKFEDVEYSVTIKAPQTSWFEKSYYTSMVPRLPGLCNEKTQARAEGITKQLLHGTSGIVKPGEILAILGPSGSGKTSLLDILGGRVRAFGGRKLSGEVVYNGSSFSRGIKRRTGFVTQDNVLLQRLTVKESLVYAAYLRLPDSDYSKAEKVQRAEDVITELGLEKCRHTVIGGPFVRGVSGGEKKRVSIGHEMLINPSLLLLDEPTSGLDSTIALKIIHTLRHLAKGGRTIVTTIHQPSSIIYHTFNKLLLLSEGHTLYFGRGSEAMSYFKSVGFSPTFATNPADFLLDLASGITYDVMDMNNHEPEAEAIVQEKNSSNEPGADPQKVLSTLKKSYSKTLLPKTRASISNYTKVTEEENRAALEKMKWPTSWIEQVFILISRGVKERRHEVFAGFRVTQVLVVSIIVGLLWWQSTPDKIQDQVGLLFFMTTFWGFFPVFTAIFMFPPDRQMMTKERASGMYRLSAYFLARTIGELPLELVLPTVSVTIVYWMTGLKKTAGAYICYVFITLLTVLVSQGLGLFLGAALMEVKKATTLSSVLLTTAQLAGGYFVQTAPAWIIWTKYVSFAYYSFKLQLIVQFSTTQTYLCPTGRCLIADYPAVIVVGINQLYTSVIALIAMAIGYRLLAYLSLRRMKIS